MIKLHNHQQQSPILQSDLGEREKCHPGRTTQSRRLHIFLNSQPHPNNRSGGDIRITGVEVDATDSKTSTEDETIAPTKQEEMIRAANNGVAGESDPDDARPV